MGEFAKQSAGNMFDDDNDDQSFMVLVLGVLAGVLAVICWWFLANNSTDLAASAQPEPTVTEAPAPTPEAEPTVEPTEVAAPALEPGSVLAAIGAAGTDSDNASSIVLSGEVATQELADTIVAAAESSFDDVTNELVVNVDGIDAEVAPELTLRGLLGEEQAQVVRRTFSLDDFVLVDEISVIVPEPTAEPTEEPAPEPEQVVADLNDLFGLEPIRFASGSADIEVESEATLDRAAELLVAAGGSGRAVEVQGHTDSRGSAASNISLSQARAEAVVSYLIESGVDHEQIQAVGYGEELPVADNATFEGRTLNRRIEFALLD